MLCMVASWLSSAFVAPPAGSEVAALRGTSSSNVRITGLTGALVSLVPGQAQAYSETELNQFGLVFAIFFLGFFVAGLVRMFTVGKL